LYEAEKQELVRINCLFEPVTGTAAPDNVPVPVPVSYLITRKTLHESETEKTSLSPVMRDVPVSVPFLLIEKKLYGSESDSNLLSLAVPQLMPVPYQQRGPNKVNGVWKTDLLGIKYFFELVTGTATPENVSAPAPVPILELVPEAVKPMVKVIKSLILYSLMNVMVPVLNPDPVQRPAAHWDKIIGLSLM
jgi:hypothetical protein